MTKGILHVHDGSCQVNGALIVNGTPVKDHIIQYNQGELLIKEYLIDNGEKNFSLNYVVGFIRNDPSYKEGKSREGFPITGIDRVAEECFEEIKTVMKENGIKGYVDFGQKNALINT